ncbi:MAG TPA: glycosyltransferase family A protein [Candidatus Binatia bacterium]
MSPIVSVIIPTYNRWPMVGEAMESVLAQSYRAWELIVVDDGSTDGTSEHLAQYGANIRHVSRQRSGVAAARNYGVGIARGRYVAFLDSDDLWMVKKLAIQMAFVEQHPEVQICQTEEIWFRRGVRVNPKAKHVKPSGDIFRRSLDLCLVSPSAVMITKQLFNQFGGFDESFPVCEDYDLWLRIGVDHLVPLIPMPLVVKRGGHRDQLSHSIWGMDRYRVQSLRKLLDNGLSGEKREWVMEALKRKISVLCQGARKRGKEYEATAYEGILSEVLQETLDVGDRDSPICERQGIPSADSGTVVGLGSAG